MSRIVLALALFSSPALAQEDDDAVEGGITACELCEDLDETEEQCEAEFGDGHVMCEAIGTVEEACPQRDEGEIDDDGGTDDGAEGAPDAACPDLCGEVPALLETCASELGAGHALCDELQELSDECGAEPQSSLASCSVLGAAGGGGLLLALGLLGLRLRKRQASADPRKA